MIAFPATIPVPGAVVEILGRLEEAGYETWCVGGAIRDALLGDPQQDVDLATAATPDDVRRLFRRTIPVGIEHGTVGVLDEDGVLHEVTTFRRDVRTDGRHAVVEFGVSLDDDLARRDFTINAIAWHPIHGTWRDPFGGRDDLERRLVRAVGEPATRFREDRLRILRALRFAARFDFTIEAATWAAALAQAGETGHLSPERVRDEWVKGLGTARRMAAFAAAWADSGVSAVWLPELVAAEAIREASGTPDVMLRTAHCCRPVAPVWRRLRGSNAEIRRAEAIDAGPAAPAGEDAVAVRRWMAEVGAAADDLIALAAWDGAPAWTAVVREVRARGEATSRAELAVTGQHLLAAGVPGGPALGAALQRLLDHVLVHPDANHREELLALALRDLGA